LEIHAQNKISGMLILLLPVNVAMHLHARCLSLSPEFNRNWNLSTDISKTVQCHNLQTFLHRPRQAETQTDTMKLRDIFMQIFIMNVQKNLPSVWARPQIIKNLVQTTHGL